MKNRILKNFIFLIMSLGLLVVFSPSFDVLAADGDVVWEKTNNIPAGFLADYYPEFSVRVGSALFIASDGNATGGGVRINFSKIDTTNGATIWSTNGSYEFISSFETDGNALYSISSVGQTAYLEKRSLANGSLIWRRSMGIDGGDLAVDSSGVYFAGYSHISCGTSCNTILGQIQKRRLTDGALIWGKVVTGNLWHYNGIKSDGNYVYGLRPKYTSGTSIIPAVLEKRDVTTGGLIWSSSIPTGNVPRLVAVDTEGIYFLDSSVNSSSVSNAYRWRIDKRKVADGSLLWKKEVILNRANIGSLAVDGSGVYVSGSVNRVDDWFSIRRGDWRVEKRDIVSGDIVWQKEFSRGASKFVVPLGGTSLDNDGIFTVGIDGYANAMGFSVHKLRIEKREKGGITINGACGSYTDVSNTYMTFPPAPIDANYSATGLCAATGGVLSLAGISGAGPWTWTCEGSGTGHTDASCTAQKTVTCTYFSQTCAFTNSVDCSNVANCGQANTSTAVCTAINSCTGSAENRPLIECGASCVTATSNCAACSAVRQGNWREVSR